MKTYLILRFSSVGNIAMTVPIIASLSRRYPDDRFIVVSKKRLSALFYGMENVKFHEADFTLPGLRGGLKSIWQLYHELKRYEIDEVIDLQDVIRTRIIRTLFAWHHKPVRIIDYGRTEKKAMTLTGFQGKRLITEFERYARTFAQAGLETDDQFEHLSVNKDALQKIRERYGIKTGKWLGIAPFAKSKSNMLPYRTIKEVIAHYAEQTDVQIFLFGAGEMESEVLKQWASVFPRTISVAGILPLEEEMELMRQLDVMLCMDSANQHLASLVGLRVVSIWCATHPGIGFYGWKQSEADCIQTRLSCRPCSIHGTDKCRFRNDECKKIKSEDIWQKLSL
ncbi:MAG: glycosyltransferase family 9 protein [Paludibacteraceae bacterium]|nr:glycosyltransferase family 9 protein [Paludibacteraceae bacterium]